MTKPNLHSVINEDDPEHGYIELIQQMAAALELCLSCEGGPLTWAAEQDASVTLERANRVLSERKTRQGR